jgi:hypothetical protein
MLDTSISGSVGFFWVLVSAKWLRLCSRNVTHLSGTDPELLAHPTRGPVSFQKPLYLLANSIVLLPD